MEIIRALPKLDFRGVTPSSSRTALPRGISMAATAIFVSHMDMIDPARRNPKIIIAERVSGPGKKEYRYAFSQA